MATQEMTRKLKTGHAGLGGVTTRTLMVKQENSRFVVRALDSWKGGLQTEVSFSDTQFHATASQALSDLVNRTNDFLDNGWELA